MQKLKKAIAVLLLTVLAMHMSYTQSPIESNKKLQPQFKIELTKQDYGKEEVEKILLIFFEETNKSIDAAFSEGYKQGLLASAPDTEYYKSLAVELEKEIKKMNATLTVPWWSIPVSILSGTALGFSLSFLRK